MNYLAMVLKSVHKHEKKRRKAYEQNKPYPDYSTIVTGESFFKIEQSERLVDCFMELALTSRFLIACRLSPE